MVDIGDLTAFVVHDEPSDEATLDIRVAEFSARRVPWGEKATDRTAYSWPRSVASSSPVAVSQSLMVLSTDPEARRAPSGEKATEYTPYS